MQPTATNITLDPNLLPTTGEGMLFVFYAIALLYTIFTGVFYYHWQQYGTNKKMTWLTYVLYIGTTLPLIMIMGSVTLAF